MLTFLIASDRATIRTHFKKLCDSGELSICAEAVTLEQTLSLAKSHQPGVIIFNFRCSVARQTKTIMQIKGRLPKVRVLVLTSRESARSTRAYLAAGASALLPSQCTYQDLVYIVSGAGAGFNIVPIRSLPAPKAKLAYRAVSPVADETWPEG